MCRLLHRATPKPLAGKPPPVPPSSSTIIAHVATGVVSPTSVPKVTTLPRESQATPRALQRTCSVRRGVDGPQRKGGQQRTRRRGAVFLEELGFSASEKIPARLGPARAAAGSQDWPQPRPAQCGGSRPLCSAQEGLAGAAPEVKASACSSRVRPISVITRNIHEKRKTPSGRATPPGASAESDLRPAPAGPQGKRPPLPTPTPALSGA